MEESLSRVSSALAWLAGGCVWTFAGLVNGGNLEALWIPADLLLLLGLILIGRLGLHGRTKTGRAGLLIAGVGRVTFVVAEVLSAIENKDQNALLPAAALLSAIGMTLYGVGVLKAHRWSGPWKLAPLTAGLYPFVVMFPIVAASGGNPSETAIAIWGIALAGIGAAVWLTAPTSIRAERPGERTAA